MDRNLYLNRIIALKDKDIIKIITGIRRSGKSYLLFNLYKSYLLKTGIPQERILSLNLESGKNACYRNSESLYSYFSDLIKTEEKYYIFIDEVQLCSNFEDAVNGLKVDFNSDIYITGSNSKLLSREINTKLRGRGMEIKIYPYSFAEFFTANSFSDKQEAFKNYILYGGLPFVSALENDYEKKEYLEMVNETVFEKDIVERNGLRNRDSFDSVMKVLYSSIGSPVSANNIANTLKSTGAKSADNETVSSYLEYLTDSYLFYKVQRYDLKGRKYLSTQCKYYACDMGLRNEKLNYRQIEPTHILENLVFLELLRRGYKVDIGKNAETEIDFVARTHEDLIYVQVSYSLFAEEIFNREIRAFKNLDDAYRKIIITMDNDPFTFLEKGIKKINALDFLLGAEI